MNTVMMMPAEAPRFYVQRHNVSRLHNVASCPAVVSAPVATEQTKSRAYPRVTTLQNLTDIIGQSAPAASERTPQAMMYIAEAQEKLICEAETALACQSVRTYRRWYSHWRHRGVQVNDLLDMTWVWRQRARTE
ncbi:MAG: hypothetical protein E7J63_18200 [Pantoea sp.]|uniref:hypothetical protein n=1 Tax=Pantoea sp. TaxID=69393 RepID=UPI00291302C0|nr:hypothetical protein [Pantoea sp.]MDU7840221.1 hypothetical protein [Pantoea sp.]